MINVTKTYLPDKRKYQAYVDKIFDSGWITNNGSLVNELERELCRFLNVKHLVLVSNGTLALQVAYKVLGLKNEVITTPFSFVATTSSLLWEHLTPVFADINPDSFNIDVQQVVQKINSTTSAILPVHVFGNACEVEELEKICTAHNIKLIFDAAHAFDVKNEKRNILSYGDASILSFHATKIFHTIEGGAIIFKRKEDYDRAKLLINFGISGYDKVDTVGINCKMNEFQAAMGLAVLSEMKEIADKRKEVWMRYYNRLQSQSKIKLQSINPDFCMNYAYFPVVFQQEEITLNIQRELNKMEIYPRRYFYPSLNKLDYLHGYQPCPVSENLVTRILCLPLFGDLEASVQDQIIEVICKNTI
ncbi:MAG: DegT/DnrJ/EryC1/StrS family aminotransferase [Paludibacter sp.]|nr:DegT/DnrJ/EryC1/StrS family aminotransferase [Paludibacter sp.]MDD4198262.1 DegT/DnrJ/EryC1/StrS family aminotransferase [Paludibacter sp.]MDD4428036.1 DegT/DnrJ/EryC1/StrS family aminotransferase [Paludibacter sp.]